MPLDGFKQREAPRSSTHSVRVAAVFVVAETVEIVVGLRVTGEQVVVVRVALGPSLAGVTVRRVREATSVVFSPLGGATVATMTRYCNTVAQTSATLISESQKETNS